MKWDPDWQSRDVLFFKCMSSKCRGIRAEALFYNKSQMTLHECSFKSFLLWRHKNQCCQWPLINNSTTAVAVHFIMKMTVTFNSTEWHALKNTHPPPTYSHQHTIKGAKANLWLPAIHTISLKMFRLSVKGQVHIQLRFFFILIWEDPHAGGLIPLATAKTCHLTQVM